MKYAKFSLKFSNISTSFALEKKIQKCGFIFTHFYKFVKGNNNQVKRNKSIFCNFLLNPTLF